MPKSGLTLQSKANETRPGAHQRAPSAGGLGWADALHVVSKQMSANPPRHVLTPLLKEGKMTISCTSEAWLLHTVDAQLIFCKWPIE